MRIAILIPLFAAGLGAVAPLRAASRELPARELTLEDALQLAESRNPELAAARERAVSEEERVTPTFWLERPRLGFMREQKLSNMQLEMGPMTSWTLSQEVKFPAKYFAAGNAQSARARGAASASSDKRLEIRQRVLTAYYGWHSARRVGALLEAQRETLREIARAAETRRATGAVPQQDEMKAHVEQTRIENEILLQGQETAESEAMLRSLLNEEGEAPLLPSRAELRAPRLTAAISISELLRKSLGGSRAIEAGQAMLAEAESERSLAWLGLAPDFMLSYRRAFVNSPSDAFAIGIEASIPLWFPVSELPEIRAARARAASAERDLEKMKRETEAEVRTLGSKVGSYSRLLQIYETSLIPQSVSTLNSSRSAYSAGRTTFVELLDSERSLYSTRISYYQTLTKYVESLTRLERAIGASVSSLPFTAPPGENP